VANHTDSEMFLVSFTRHPYDAKKKKACPSSCEERLFPFNPQFQSHKMFTRETCSWVTV